MTISITRALSEMKTIDARLNQKVGEIRTIAVAVNDKLSSGVDPKEFSKDAIADYQSYIDLVERKNRLKAAVVASNAITKVTIAGQQMTVAAAIEKKSSIQYLHTLVAALTHQLSQATSAVEKHNLKVQEQLQQLLQANFGKDRKATEEEQNAIVVPYLRNNEASLVDPLELRNTIRKLREDIVAFEGEVDFVLSESNAITQVEV